MGGTVFIFKEPTLAWGPGMIPRIGAPVRVGRLVVGSVARFTNDRIYVEWVEDIEIGTFQGDAKNVTA